MGSGTVAELLARLESFRGEPAELLEQVLWVQCRVTRAVEGVALRQDSQNQARVVAAVTTAQGRRGEPAWLKTAAAMMDQVLADGRVASVSLPATDGLYGEAGAQRLVLVPLTAGDQKLGMTAMRVDATRGGVQAAMELTLALPRLYALGQAEAASRAESRRLARCIELLAATNDHDRFMAAAMAVCNQVAASWQAQRVSLGLNRGQDVRLRAMSHTEKLVLKTRLAQAVEAAMEECADQDAELIHPVSPEATSVHRMTTALATEHGLASVCSLPLRRGGEVAGVLTVERGADRPWSTEEVEGLRLAADLCAARLLQLEAQDRWAGAKAAKALRRALAWMVGPRHTWAKAAAAAGTVAVVWLCVWQGVDRVEAEFTLEAVDRRPVPMPFDGFLYAVEPGIEPGSRVQAGQLLASLDTRALLDQLDVAASERGHYQVQAGLAMRDGKTAEQQMAEAQAAKAAAQVRLLTRQIEQSRIRSPITGVVTQGDLERRAGSPFAMGEVLFEVAPVEALRAELRVPEGRIAEVKVGLRGELASDAYPDQKVGFVVEHVHPVAQVVEGRNVFAVRVALDQDEVRKHDWPRPGVTGVGKVEAGRRSVAVIWTRDLVNWIRMKLWI